MQQSNTLRAWRRKAISLLLALTILLGLVPGFPGASETASAHWADSYLSQLVEWGFIREDQAGYPDRALTRAEFMAIVNRAYGYHEMGETPFEDVAVEDWYYDDVGIAYTARYINGTSPTTASPNHALTRETAATILGRNMMLEESNGELLDFTDARQISSWAKGTIKSSLEHYLVSGYDDGTFRPQRNVSWGEMASMVTALVGTPLQEAGDYALGGVYGNVTITSPGVKLRDTVVSGDLYITGGVGLGGVELENVTVLGRIIASGAGQAEGGADSILLRNVTADELLVDNLQDNYVSVRADGVTEIGKTTVRTSAYIEDNTPEGLGLQYISLEAESYPEGEEPEGWVPPQLDLAGRIGEVVNRTPGSQVRAASGTVAKLTVDEAAVGSTVIIDRGTVVKELNLDTGVEVTGQGDVGKLTVNAPGCTVEMLPDEIEIRPGITATINGEEMDSVAAKESSEQPMILAGYPEAQDVVPTGLDAAFMTNKAGTIYWAVSALTDGSVGEEDLIKPPSYGNIAVKNGSVKVAKGNEETISKVAGLTPGGSYYLSAILVDGRGQRSAVKVISFTTPDNTVPAFNTGYPRMSKVSRTDSVVVVMPNKDCKLYYALLPESAAAPTENELKSSAVAGALGYGVRDVKKNVEDAFRVNDVILDETTNYVLYLWLVDADGVNKGKITSLKFTTDDETPPEFIVDPQVEESGKDKVKLRFRLNENGTVYWVAVPAGTPYPKAEPGTDYETAPLNSAYAKLQVSSGMNIGSSGKAGKVSAKENADGTITVSGLAPETTYDFYYVAKDNAGPDRNFSEMVKKITISTKDSTPPTFSQSFTSTINTSDDTRDPRADTGIYIKISENVQYVGANGTGSGRDFVTLYQEVTTATGEAQTRAINRLASDLYNSIRLKKYNLQQDNEELTTSSSYKYDTSQTFASNMVVDYTQVEIQDRRRQGEGIWVYFPPESLHLDAGGRYCFEISGLYDIASDNSEPNRQNPDPINFLLNRKGEGNNVPPFDVEFPTVYITRPDLTEDDALPKGGTGGTINTNGTKVREDKARIFRLRPVSTNAVADNIRYDVLLWSNCVVSFDLYYRVVDKDGKSILGTDGKYPASIANGDDTIENYLLPGTEANTVDDHGWMFLKNSGELDSDASWSGRGRAVNMFFNDCNTSTIPRLKYLNEDLRYDFAIMPVSYIGNSDIDTWSGTIEFNVNVAAGTNDSLVDKLGARPTPDAWKAGQELAKEKGLTEYGATESIGRLSRSSDNDTLTLSIPNDNNRLPNFEAGTPSFPSVESNAVSILLTLSASGNTEAVSGTVYYAIGKAIGDNGKTPAITTIRKEIGSDRDASGNLKPGLVEAAPDKAGKPRVYATLNGNEAPPTDGRTMPVWMKGVAGDSADADRTDASIADKPEGTNWLDEPLAENIVNRRLTSGAVIAYGSASPQTGVEFTVTLTNADLQPGKHWEPNTDYYAYFVITRTNDKETKSHVYVYRFRTPEAMTPSVILTGEQVGGDNGTEKTGNVNMSINTVTEGRYRVITESDATNGAVSILTKPFAEYTDHKGKDDTATGDKGTDKTPEIYLKKTDADGNETDFTVLDALTTPYSFVQASFGDSDYTSDEFYYPNRYADGSGTDGYWQFEDTGYSVFDMYADKTARLQLYSYIGLTNSLQPPESSTAQSRDDGITAEGKNKLTNELEKGEDRADTMLEIGKNLSNGSYLILTYSIDPNMKDSKAPAGSDVNTYMIAAFSGLVFDKGPVGAPALEYISGNVSKDESGSYTGNITIAFDRPTFLTKSPKRLLMTTDNLFTGGSDTVTWPSVSKSMVPGDVTAQSFTINISSALKTDYVRFPNNYFSDGSNDPMKEALQIDFRTINGKDYVVVTLNGKEYDKIEVSEGGGRTVQLSGDYTGEQSSPVVNLEVNGTATITGQMNPTGDMDTTTITYTWRATSGSDVVKIDPNGTPDLDGKVTITGLKPGKAVVRVDAAGYKKEGGRESAYKLIDVTVTGTVDDFSPNTISLEIGKSTSVPVKANGEPLSSNAKVKVDFPNNVQCTVVGDQLTITSNTKSKAGETAEITVGLVAEDGTDLTPSAADKKKITVTFTPAPTTYGGRPSADNNTQIKPTSLTLDNDHLNGSTLTLRADDKATTVTATINPPGATGTVTWDTTYTDTNVATVTKNGTVTPKGIGSTTVTAKVTGTSISKTITINVRGAISGLTMTSPTKSTSNVTWNSGSNSLTLARGGGVTPTATFTVKAADDAAVSNKTALVTCSVPKDQKDYVKCTIDPANNKITIVPGSASPAKDTTVKVTIGIVTRSGSISLTPGTSDKLVLNVQIKGNDASLNVAGKLNR